jgi:hypothetical protein
VSLLVLNNHADEDSGQARTRQIGSASCLLKETCRRKESSEAALPGGSSLTTESELDPPPFALLSCCRAWQPGQFASPSGLVGISDENRAQMSAHSLPNRQREVALAKETD